MNDASYTLEDSRNHVNKEVLEKYASLFVLKHKLKNRIIRWFFRSTIEFFIFGYLAMNYTWGKWVLGIWATIALLTLVGVISLFFYCRRQANEIKNLGAEVTEEMGNLIIYIKSYVYSDQYNEEQILHILEDEFDGLDENHKFFLKKEIEKQFTFKKLHATGQTSTVH